MSEVTDAFRNGRLAAGLAQWEIAEAMQVSQAFISQFERGDWELDDQYLDKLPAPVKTAVVKAKIREAQARVRWLKGLLE